MIEIAHKKHILDISNALVTLKIMSRAPKSNLLFPFSQQCIFASLVKIHPLVQKITHRNHILAISSASVALKIKATKI